MDVSAPRACTDSGGHTGDGLLCGEMDLSTFSSGCRWEAGHNLISVCVLICLLCHMTQQHKNHMPGSVTMSE